MVKEPEDGTQQIIPGIRTMEADAENLAKSGVSLIELAARQKRIESAPETQGTEKHPFLKILIPVLIIGSIGAASVFSYYFYFKRQSQNSLPPPVVIKPIFTTENTEKVVLDANDIKDNKKVIDLIIKKIKTPISLGDTLYVPIIFKAETGEESEIETGKFLEILAIKPPPVLLSSLGDKFMIVKYYNGGDLSSLVFKIKDYNSAVAGMIKWEKNILNDLSPLLLIPLEDTNKNGSFTDREVENRNTRQFLTEDGRVLIIYSFINENYLIITNSEASLKEIFKRFSSSRYFRG